MYRLAQQEEVTAETVLHQILYSAALKMIDFGVGSSYCCVSTYLRWLLSSQRVSHNGSRSITMLPYGCDKTTSFVYETVSKANTFRLSSYDQYNNVADLFDALAKLSYKHSSFKGESVYVVFTDHSLVLNHLILHKQIYNESTIDATYHSNIVFRGNSEDRMLRYQSAPLYPLIRELTTSLEHLTDPARFQTVSSVLLNHTQFPVVLIELALAYCFCVQLR